eukprot:jgi/Psemu1/306265/fgenesh1_kg.245_\
MKSVSSITAILLLALVLALFNTGYSFQASLNAPNSRSLTTELFGKRAKIAKKVKKIFGGDGDDEGAVPVPVAEPDSNFPVSGKKIKMSNGRAKDLAKKYKDIDDIGERAFQILVDLKMVGRS